MSYYGYGFPASYLPVTQNGSIVRPVCALLDTIFWLTAFYMSCLSVKFFFWLSDLCEQRGRAQRLHQSGERKEEGLRALRCPGDHLRQTFRKMKTETERVRERERSGWATWRSSPHQKLEFELVKAALVLSARLPLCSLSNQKERWDEKLLFVCKETGDHCVTGFYLNLS